MENIEVSYQLNKTYEKHIESRLGFSMIPKNVSLFKVLEKRWIHGHPGYTYWTTIRCVDKDGYMTDGADFKYSSVVFSEYEYKMLIHRIS